MRRTTAPKPSRRSQAAPEPCTEPRRARMRRVRSPRGQPGVPGAPVVALGGGGWSAHSGEPQPRRRPRHPSEPAGRLSSYPTRTPSAVSGPQQAAHGRPTASVTIASASIRPESWGRAYGLQGARPSDPAAQGPALLRYVVRPIDSSPLDGPPSSAHGEQSSRRRTIGPALRAGRALARIRETKLCCATATIQLR
jgi:hypothetical protein